MLFDLYIFLNTSVTIEDLLSSNSTAGVESGFFHTMSSDLALLSIRPHKPPLLTLVSRWDGQELIQSYDAH